MAPPRKRLPNEERETFYFSKLVWIILLAGALVLSLYAIGSTRWIYSKWDKSELGLVRNPLSNGWWLVSAILQVVALSACAFGGYF